MPGCEEGIGIRKRGGHRAFWQRFSDLMATFKLPLSELFEVRDGALFTSDFSVPDTVPGAMSVLIRDLENWTEPIYCPFSLASARTRKEAKPPYCLFTHTGRSPSSFQLWASTLFTEPLEKTTRGGGLSTLTHQTHLGLPLCLGESYCASLVNVLSLFPNKHFKPLLSSNLISIFS